MGVKTEGRPPVEGAGLRDKVYSRTLDRSLDVRDARAEIARASRRPRAGSDDLRAFLASKREMIRAHPTLTQSQKECALAEIGTAGGAAERELAEAADDGDSGGGDGDDGDPPLPGGVGFGVFYRPAFKIDFESGTAAEFDILCPTRPGGNLDSWLYLTAMNRAARGVEAFVAYERQNEFRFVVFDWARTEQWQVDLPYAALGPYVRPLLVGGSLHQSLHVLNLATQTGADDWSNEVYLRNSATGTLDLIYLHEYPSTAENQRAGWTGSWGPIVETFHDSHQQLEPLGFSSFATASRRGAGWDGWRELDPSESYVQEDGVGFRMSHLDPNHTFIAES